MRGDLLAALGFAAVSATGYASSCTTPSGSSSPTTIPSITITAEPTPVVIQPPPTSSAPAQDPAGCPASCEKAQTACRKNTPKPLADCVSSCSSSARVAAPSLDCLAVMFTCDEECPR